MRMTERKGKKENSNTSFFSMFQREHLVSTLVIPIIDSLKGFQSKLVNGSIPFPSFEIDVSATFITVLSSRSSQSRKESLVVAISKIL